MTKTVIDAALKDRIKELEDIIKKALRCGWHSMEGSLKGGFNDLTDAEILDLRVSARNALKEIE